MKNFIKKITLFTFSILTVGILVSNSNNPIMLKIHDQAQAFNSINGLNLENSPSAPIKNNEFDIDTLKVGDKIGDMKVRLIRSIDPNSPRTKDNLIVEFEGETIVQGKYKHDATHSIFPYAVCMDSLTPESEEKLPRLRGEDKNISFCFHNEEFAKEQFAPDRTSGTAQVKITDYIYVRYPIKPVNLAVLVSILQRS